jgi:hypothetical protein
MEPRTFDRFSETMADEEPEPQMLAPYTLERKAGCYVMLKNVEGLLRMLVFQGPEWPGEKSVCVADLLFTREQFQEMMRVMRIPGL